MVGIYKITNIYNKKCYIGGSVSVKDRIRNHKKQLGCGEHYNRWLQADYDKYGEYAFKYEIIEECERKELRDKEKYYIEKFSSFNKFQGYNIQRGWGSNYSHSHAISQERNYSYQEDFFKNGNNEIEYNPLCVDCKYDCKQSFRATIERCWRLSELKKR